MKRIEAAITPRTLDTFKAAAPKSRLSFTLLASHSCEVAEAI
jgi:hypothetical protein